MAIHLETTRDFLEVARLLKSPKSKPHQYQIKQWGYCTLEKCITIYSWTGGIEGSVTTCHGCGKQFGSYGSTRYYDASLYITDENDKRIPPDKRKLLMKLRSRTKQKENFRSALQGFLREQQKARLVLSRLIRGLKAIKA